MCSRCHGTIYALAAILTGHMDHALWIKVERRSPHDTSAGLRPADGPATRYRYGEDNGHTVGDESHQAHTAIRSESGCTASRVRLPDDMPDRGQSTWRQFCRLIDAAGND